MTDQAGNRRSFLGALGLGSLAAAAGAMPPEAAAQSPGAKIMGAAGIKTSQRPQGTWKPVSDRKIRVGIVGYGVCQFGAVFGFQDHPNVEIVAVSDLMPDRCAALARACRCEKTYPSLEELVKDDKIEAVFVATDAPSHAKHCIDCYMKEPIPSFKGWRVGLPPQWYPTHSNAYYVCVTDGSFTEVSCMGMPSVNSYFQPQNNPYKNVFGTEVAQLRTNEGGVARMVCSWDSHEPGAEAGRVRGQKGAMWNTSCNGDAKQLPSLAMPPLPPAWRPAAMAARTGT